MKQFFTLIILLLGTSFSASAQINHPNSKERLAHSQTKRLFGKKETYTLVIKALANNMQNDYNAPNLPTFSVIGKDRKYYLGIGGYAKATLWYDYSNLDMLPSTDTSGKLDNVAAWAGYVSLQYNFTSSVYISPTYSAVRTSAPDTTYQPRQYKNARYVATNLFWNLAPQVQMGTEYLWGDLQVAGDEEKHNSRIQTMIQINF